jgi:hypothetical protein
MCNVLQVVVDDITFRVGDAAYVVLKPTKYREFVESPDKEPGEVEQGACHACGREAPEDNAFIECDYCMRNFHLACTEAAGGGFWKCSECVAGRKRRRYPQTMAQAFVQLDGAVGLVRIEAIMQVGASKMFEARWFYRPADTVHGVPYSMCFDSVIRSAWLVTLVWARLTQVIRTAALL